MIVLPFGFQPLIIGLVTILLFFNIVWFWAYLYRRNDFADIAWGPAVILGVFGALSWTLNIQGRTVVGVRVLILCTLTTVWALRLFWYIAQRNLSKKTEDLRYAKWRKEWGTSWPTQSYLKIFTLQPLIIFAVSLPALWAVSSPPQELDLTANLGILVWLVGFFFESVGDAQLKDFSRHPENHSKIMSTGLWKWSRHPNYFGEVVQWWGLFLIVATMPGGWIAVLSPLTITYVLLKVSGIPVLEDHMRSRPGYLDYQRRVSKFLPFPPKRS